MGSMTGSPFLSRNNSPSTTRSSRSYSAFVGTTFTTLDLIIFFGSLTAVMAIGLLAGRKEETSEDYFLAGRRIPWWGVAGSIFGSNVSANHMIGMMGIGFSVGFAQSHFELGAIAGLMLLCYGFLPVYRKLKVYTLAEYLGLRYDDRSRLAYAVTMILIMAVVQLVPALYIGARSTCILMGGEAVEQVSLAVEPAVDSTDSANSSSTSTGSDQVENEPSTKLNVDRFYYALFVIALAAISASYTIFGGLKAVIWTDVMQSFLLLLAGIVLALLTFDQIGGWGEMMLRDRAGVGKMHLYLPSHHPELPWTGVLTGLMALHFFYWGTNQFIVQRALAARSYSEARIGIVAAGFLKLLIPFFAIGTGVAAFYLFQERLPHRTIAPDTAFTELVLLVVQPIGFGIIGCISAGVIGAILSSIDSMMNSAATIVTMDIYRRYINPNATDAQMIRIGRLSIVAFVSLAALMAIWVLDPNSDKNFFLQIVDYQGYLTPGLLVVFVLGLFWRGATATGAFTTILAGVPLSGLVELVYNSYLGTIPGITVYLGERLNFFHRVFAVIVLCCLVHVLVSRLGGKDQKKQCLVWADLGDRDPRALRRLLCFLAIWISTLAGLGFALHAGQISPTLGAWLGALTTLLLLPFARAAGLGSDRGDDARGNTPSTPGIGLLKDDVTWASLLCSAAVFMMYYFY